MNSHLFFFAYFGPETMLPMTSIVATIVGIFMMFGRNSIRLITRYFRFPRLRRAKRANLSPRPHFRVRDRVSETASRT
jgi:hypothetical protein